MRSAVVETLPLSWGLEIIDFKLKADTIPKWIFEEYKED